MRNGGGVGFDRPRGDDRPTMIIQSRMTWRHRAVQAHKNMPLWQELPLLLVVAFCLAVLVILEAVLRLLPGVLGNAESLVEESHADGLLEAPVYTKPPEWRALPVPEILRSGDHGRIARWRRDRALLRTAARRPDLLAALPPDALDKHDRAVLTGAGFQISTPDMAK